MGDTLGATTYFGHQCNHPTTIDYCLAHEDIFDQLTVFSIYDFTPYSDHCMINTALKTGSWKPGKPHKSVPLKPLPSRFIWDKLMEQVYINKLSSDECQPELENFLNHEFGDSITDVSSASDQLNSIIKSAAEGVFKK